MSGPKHYTPPPRYSIKVFNGQLNEVFQLQSKLKLLIEEIKKSSIQDKSLNIHFDCLGDFKSMESEIVAVLERLEFNYRGSFGQETYNKILSEINTRIRDLKLVIERCDDLLESFHRKEIDYISYSDYHRHFEQSKASFSSFKQAVGVYFKNNLPEGENSLYSDFDVKLNPICFELPKAPFEFGFHANYDTLSDSVVAEVFEKEKKVNAVRMDFNNQLIERYPDFRITNKSKKLPNEVKEISEKILKIIASGVEPEIAVKYRAELDDLQQSDSLIDVFYYQQLHDRILNSEKSKKNKERIHEIFLKLNKVNWHENVWEDKNILVSYCLDLLNKPYLDTREVARVYEKEKDLKLKSDFHIREKEILESERIFLKNQIVNSLENMGYEVMDDLEVIDFEKSDDLLLKCKDKCNYLNLKFKEDGSIKYSFQMPENKDSLSENELKFKLSQMNETCSDFQQVLGDLAKMGLRMELKDAKPTSEKWLLTITEKQKEKLKPKKRKTTTKQGTKKYLD